MTLRPLLNASCLATLLLSVAGCSVVQSPVPQTASATLQLPDSADQAVVDNRAMTSQKNSSSPTIASGPTIDRPKTNGNTTAKWRDEPLADQGTLVPRPAQLPPTQSGTTSELNDATADRSSRFEPLWITRR